MQPDLLFVTGAPGAGKSQTVKSLLGLNTDYLVLDIDWLAETASDLAEKDIYSDPTTWMPYGKLWFEVLHSICRNSIQPIFFCPNSPADVETFGKPAWCRDIHWLLLDCSDKVRAQRLKLRSDWNEQRNAQAFDDAVELRNTISTRLDTGTAPSEEAALQVLDWADSRV